MIPTGVVLDTRTVSPRFPGIGRYVTGLLSGLSEAPTLLVSSRDPRLRQDATVSVSASPFDLRQQWEVPRALRACGARLYHSPYYLMPLAPGTATIVNCWDMIPLAVPGLFDIARRLAFRVAHLLAFRAARVILVPTEATRHDVTRFFPTASAGKLAVVPLGSDTGVLPRHEAEARRRALGLPSAYALYAGGNKPHKNLPLLVQAWASAIRRAPTVTRGVQLVVAGPSDSRYPRAAAAAGAAGIASRVVDLGHVDETTLSALYSGARLFVFPSRYEGFGLPVVEAMAHGAPVVCTRTPALAEVAGEAAATCAADDAEGLAAVIVRVLEDGGERDRLRAAGLSRAGHFTWAATARATAAAYDRALRLDEGMIGAPR